MKLLGIFRRSDEKALRWKRRIRDLALILIGVALLARLVVSVMLPIVLNGVARAYHLKCQYDRLDLSILGGNAQIWNVRLVPEEGGEPVVRAEYGQGDISLLDLLRGRLVVYRLEADGVELTIERTADGHMPILARFLPSSSSSSAPVFPGTESLIDLQAPLRIDALRLQHVRARFHDQFVSPELDAQLALDLRLNDFGVADKPTRFELDFSSDPVLDSLKVIGESDNNGRSLQARFRVLMRGLHPEPASGYLAYAGLRPAAQDISASVDGQLNMSVAPNPLDGVQATLTMDNGSVTCDSKETASIDHLSLDAQSVTAGSARLGQLLISGVRCQGHRSASGAFGALGVEFAPPTSATAGSSGRSFSTSELPGFRWSLNSLMVENLHAGLVDDSVSPSVSLGLDLGQFACASFVDDPDHPDVPVNFFATMTAPGIATSIQLSGQAKPFAEKKSFNLKVKVQGIAPTAIQPYLSAAGLTSEWANGTFALTADGLLSADKSGRLAADARLDELRLADQQDLLALHDARLQGFRFDPSTTTIHADAIDVAGPDLSIARDAAGDVHALGFRLDLHTPHPQRSVPVSPADVLATLSGFHGLHGLPHIEIGHFAWTDIHVNWVDNAFTPPTTLAITDAGVKLENFVINPSDTAPIKSPGTIRAWITVPGVLPDLALDGTCTAAGNKTIVAFDVHGDHICGAPLAPYLKSLGVEPTLQNGSLRLHTDMELDDNPDGPSLSVTLTNCSFSDGKQSLFSVDSVDLRGMRAQGDELSLDAVEVVSPHTRVLRRDDGSLEAAGVHLIGGGNEAAADVITLVESQPKPARPDVIVRVKSLAVKDAAIGWVDRSVQPVVDTTGRLEANLSDFTFGPSAATNQSSSRLHIRAGIGGSVDSLIADGTVAASPDHQAVDLDVTAVGVRAGPAAAYLPRNVRPISRNSRFHAGVLLAMDSNPRGGVALNAKVSKLEYRDGANQSSLADFDLFHLGVSRFDPAARVIAVDDLSLDGFDANIERTPAGVDLLGLEIQPAQTAAPPPDAMSQIATQRNQYPQITLHNLDVNSRRVSIVDHTGAKTAPLIVSNVRLRNTSDIVWLGRDAESNPPTDLQLTGRLDPLADAFKMDIHANPFLRQKTLQVDFAIGGIHGKSLVAMEPGLVRYVDAGDFESGRLDGSANAVVQLQNVRPTDFSLGYGGKLNFDVNDVNLRATPNGPVVAGVHEIRSDGVRLGPDLNSIEAKEVDVDDIVGQIVRDRDGIHVLGMTLKNPQTSARTSAQSSDDAQANNVLPSTEVKIDRLLISGINFPIEDQTVNPPFIAPINGLDVEAVGLSNMALYQDRPIRFSAVVNSGKVPLARRNGKGNLPEQGELFSQVTCDGAVSLWPNLKGWAKASISGFELISLKDLAHKQNITVGGGTFDGDVDLRFPGDGSIDTSSRLVLTDLSLDEPPNGPIQRTLHLPGVLDDVIGVLEDQDGSIVVPLNITIRQDQLDESEVVAAATGAFLPIVTSAIASSPLKVANIFGPGSSNQPEPPQVMPFPAGYPDLGPAQWAVLAPLAQRLRDDQSLQVTIRHDLGSDDVALAAQRVNPSSDDILAMADSLNSRRQALLSAQASAASDVRALLASTAADEANSAVKRLRIINTELADIDNEQDQIYDLLRAGADRQAIRRTRAASLAIARARVDAVRDYLGGSGKHKVAAERIHTSNPQFNANPDNAAGRITIIVVRTK